MIVMTEVRRQPPADDRMFTRRGVLWVAAGVAGVAAVGGVGIALAPTSVKRQLGIGPDPYIPDAPEGQVRLEQVDSAARGQEVDLFTAVPAGYGDGAGLPVVVILHGSSATAKDFQPFGLARFLTQSVRDGAAPFVLAGADGGLTRWEGDGQGDDPQAMLTDEMPVWLADRGFDADRLALWGWSMGGYGCLRLAETSPDYALALAAFSPAISDADAVFDDAAALAGLPLGIWCGTDDPFYDAITDFVGELPDEPDIASYTEGAAHTRVFWNDQTLEAFAFLSQHLEAS
jgi:predicted esterase